MEKIVKVKRARYHDITINSSKYHTAIGKSELLRHLSGIKLKLRSAIKAKCYDCMGQYADGRIDCKVDTCSL